MYFIIEASEAANNF